MATTQYSSTLHAPCTLAAGASSLSGQRTLGSGVLCECINVFVDINASGFAADQTPGLNTLDCAIRPVALDGSGVYDGGPEFYQQRVILGDKAHAFCYPFRFPGGCPKLFKVALINRGTQSTATSAVQSSIEYVTVAV